MINMYIDESEVVEFRDSIVNMYHEADIFIGSDEVERVVERNLHQLAIDVKTEHGIVDGRIIMPSGTIFNVVDGWVNA